MAETQEAQHSFGLTPLNQSSSAPKAKGKFWRKMRSLFSRRPTKPSPTPHTNSSTQVQSAFHLPSASTMAPTYWNGRIESRYYGAAPGSPQQPSQSVRFPNDLSIITSPAHNGPNIYHTPIYSAISPVSEGSGFINENYSLSHEQSNWHQRTTLWDRTVAILGTDNVVRLNGQEIHT